MQSTRASGHRPACPSLTQRALSLSLSDAAAGLLSVFLLREDDRDGGLSSRRARREGAVDRRTRPSTVPSSIVFSMKTVRWATYPCPSTLSLLSLATRPVPEQGEPRCAPSLPPSLLMNPLKAQLLQLGLYPPSTLPRASLLVLVPSTPLLHSPFFLFLSPRSNRASTTGV